MALGQQEKVSKHRAFSKLTLRDLHDIMHQGEILHVPLGDTLCQEGQAAEYVFFLLEGSVLLSLEEQGQRKHVTQLKSNQGIWGWNTFETKYRFQAEVASEDALLFKIRQDELAKLFFQFPHLEKQLFIHRLPLGPALFFSCFDISNNIVLRPELHSAFKLEFFKAGETVVREGEEADKFYMIASGSAQVATSEGKEGTAQVVRNFLEPGDFFGEIGLLQDTIRSASVTATTDMALFSLSKADFKRLLDTEEGQMIYQVLSERVKSYAMEETLVIGSAPGCQLCIKGVGIAEKHAKLIKHKDSEQGTSYLLKPLANLTQYKIFVNKQPLNKETVLQPHDELFIGNYEILIDRKRDTIRARETGYHSLYVENLFYSVKQQVLIEYISFSAYSNELVCIMGPSGSGKSTLMDLIYGARKPKSGYVLYDQVSLYENIEFYRDIFGFVPQDDVLLNELTVFENLYFAAKLREPLAAHAKLEAKIDAVLALLKLSEKKHCQVGGGGEQKKVLSGGERKRVNIARELVFEPHVLFLDEPTSGLSSKDAEEVVGFLRQLSDMGKLVITVLHQPNSDIFKQFDRIVLLDKGGKLVFTGTALECLRYMKEVIYDESDVICGTCDECKPDLIFDVLERRNENNERVYPPDFWQERFENQQGYSFNEEKRLDEATSNGKKLKKQKLSGTENFGQLWTLIQRNWLKKINNKTNLVISILSPVTIAFMIAFIMRYSPPGAEAYTFSQNILIPQYLFLAVIVAVFLGLTNSARDIVGEQAIYQREIKIKLRNHWYVLSKFMVLAVISAVQVALFILVGNVILEIQGVFWSFFTFLYLASLCGAAFGLLLSALFNTAESVVNWIPLVLIPQIVFGGALVEYKEMNQQLFLNQSDQVIPEVCQFMPSRWAYEALVVAQVTRNPREAALRQLNRQREALIQLLDKQAGDTAALEEQLNALDEKLAAIDPRFDAKAYTNNELTQAVTDGSGRYDEYMGIYAQKGTGLWLNSSFLGEKKALVLAGEKNHLKEFRTLWFNLGVLLLAIAMYLLGCMTILVIKQRRGLR